MLKCKTCYKWQEVVPEFSPTFEQYKYFLSEFRKLADKDSKINFSGGEVLLSPRVLDLVRISKEHGFLTNIASNGWLIHEEMARRIADSGLDNIFLSLESLKGQTHDFLRGTEGAFQKVTSAIEYLNRHCRNLKIHVNTIIMGKNMDDIVDLAKWVIDDPRIKFVNFQAIVQPFHRALDDRWFEKKEYGYLWPEDLEKMESVIAELIKLKKKNGGKINNAISQFEVFRSYFRNPCNYVKRYACHINKKVINITASGNIYMCYKKSSIGDIKQEGFDLEKTWYSPQADSVRNDIVKCKINCQEMINAYYDESESYMREG
jgi:MoaA/NifB/PqqE/SkfB family radical SAM enzyme